MVATSHRGFSISSPFLAENYLLGAVADVVLAADEDDPASDAAASCPRSRLSLLSRSANCLRNPSLGRTSR